MSVSLSRAGGRDGALALLTAVLATLLLALLLPAGQGRAGTIAHNGAAMRSAERAAPSAPANLTPVIGHLAYRQPAEKVNVIVQMQRGVTPAEGRTLVRSEGGTAKRTVRIINGFGARISAAGAMRLAGEPGVRAVSLDGVIRSKAGPRTSYGAAVAATQAYRGWRGLSGKGIGVAIVDTGVAGELPDFRVSRRNTLSRVRVSAVTNQAASDAEDHYGHGTHIAGLIAGNGANRDLDDPLRGKYEGVAPAAHLMSVKVSDDDGNASVLDVIYGIQFVVDHADEYRIRVLNLSLASSVADSYLNDPLNAAVESAWFSGITVVAAAGNSGSAANSVSYAPGNDPFVITVGALDDQGTDGREDDRLATWSSRGTTKDGITKPEVLAPGAHMVSNLAPGSRFAAFCPECVRDDEYIQVGGTSMATAIASGTVAQILQAHRSWTPDQVKAALVSSARDLPGVGYAIDVEKAVAVVLGGGAQSQSESTGDNNSTGDDDPAAPSSPERPVHALVDRLTGLINYSAASWRAASWRGLDLDSPLSAAFAAASWRCDCSLAGDGTVDPAAASWRAASWRTSFNK